MPLTNRARLEAPRGTRIIADLLAEARDPATSLAEQEAEMQARLDAALQAGDNLIAQFLPLPAPEDASEVLIQFATDEALFYLQEKSKGGASDSQIVAADLRRRDLKAMRKRDQWAGSPKGQRSTRARIVESSSAFSRDRMKGFV